MIEITIKKGIIVKAINRTAGAKSNIILVKDYDTDNASEGETYTDKNGKEYFCYDVDILEG